MTANKNIVCLLISCIALSGCSLIPDLDQVLDFVPGQYKTQPAEAIEPVEDGNWKLANPSDGVSRGEWWKVFSDTALDDLQTSAMDANQTLKAAAARLKQARALSNVADAGVFPAIGLGFDAGRSSTPPDSFNFPGAAQRFNRTLYRGNATISYEVDLLGRVSDEIKVAELNAESSEASYQNVLLALQADVARNYFALRSIDNEREILSQTVKLREESLSLIKQRMDAGYANELDFTAATAELANTRSESIALDRERSILENALAVLTGKSPSDFRFAEGNHLTTPPAIPAGLPSDLLERRPDIVTAQKMMAAANASIGVARQAFFPKLTLTASGGYESRELNQLFRWSNRTWALGPLFGTALSVPLFDGGSNFARLDAAKAALEEASANYRQQILVGFREVEDNLISIRLLADQAAQQKKSVESSSRAVDLSNDRYKQGHISYLDAMDTQRTLLAAKRAETQIQGQRYAATVDLIRALGGGWN